MGLLGRITGWDQVKDAHNAILANHLFETAAPELKKSIVYRMIELVKMVEGRAD